MTDFLSSLSVVFQASISWMQYVLSLIVNNPALLVMCVAIPIVSRVVSLVNRLIRV